MTTFRFDSMRWLRVLAVLVAFTAQAALADAPFRIATLKIGAHRLKVEVAQTDAQREKGLMFRKQMGRDDGMLFIFDEPAYHAMWMKNTLIPLSVAFIDRNGVILNIEDMAPQTEDTHMSAGPASYSIEANKGWFAQKGVKPGDKVTGLPAMAQPKK